MSPVVIPSDAMETREMPAEGLHPAVCYAVIDLGMQKRRGPYPEPKNMVLFMFELESRLMQGQRAGERFGVSRLFTLAAFSNSHLAKQIFNWLKHEVKAGDDLEAMCYGQACTLNIQHSKPDSQGRIYANITMINPAMQGVKYWSPENGPSNPQWRFPDWVQRKRDEAVSKPADYGRNRCEPTPDQRRTFTPEATGPVHATPVEANQQLTNQGWPDQPVPGPAPVEPTTKPAIPPTPQAPVLQPPCVVCGAESQGEARRPDGSGDPVCSMCYHHKKYAIWLKAQDAPISPTTPAPPAELEPSEPMPDEEAMGGTELPDVV